MTAYITAKMAEAGLAPEQNKPTDPTHIHDKPNSQSRLTDWDVQCRKSLTIMGFKTDVAPLSTDAEGKPLDNGHYGFWGTLGKMGLSLLHGATFGFVGGLVNGLFMSGGKFSWQKTLTMGAIGLGAVATCGWLLPAMGFVATANAIPVIVGAVGGASSAIGLARKGYESVASLFSGHYTDAIMSSHEAGQEVTNLALCALPLLHGAKVAPLRNSAQVVAEGEGVLSETVAIRGAGTNPHPESLEGILGRINGPVLADETAEMARVAEIQRDVARLTPRVEQTLTNAETVAGRVEQVTATAEEIAGASRGTAAAQRDVLIHHPPATPGATAPPPTPSHQPAAVEHVLGNGTPANPGEAARILRPNTKPQINGKDVDGVNNVFDKVRKLTDEARTMQTALAAEATKEIKTIEDTRHVLEAMKAIVNPPGGGGSMGMLQVFTELESALVQVNTAARQAHALTQTVMGLKVTEKTANLGFFSGRAWGQWFKDMKTRFWLRCKAQFSASDFYRLNTANPTHLPHVPVGPVNGSFMDAHMAALIPETAPFYKDLSALNWVNMLTAPNARVLDWTAFQRLIDDGDKSSADAEAAHGHNPHLSSGRRFWNSDAKTYSTYQSDGSAKVKAAPGSGIDVKQYMAQGYGGFSLT